MKSKFLSHSSNNQLWWVILLLVVAVILPTVCLLWFMNQAVKNERLAMRQKLIDIYRGRLDEVTREKLGFDAINSRLPLVMSDGFLVFDSKGVPTFPVADGKEDFPTQEIFSSAFALEFQKDDPSQALAEYTRIAESNQNDKIVILAEMAQARCLKKIDRNEEAITKLRATISEFNDEDIYIRTQKCRAYLLLLELCHDNPDEKYKAQWNQTYDYAMNGMAAIDDMAFLGRKSHSERYIPSTLQFFALHRLISYAEDIKDPEIQKKVKKIRWFMDQLNVSITIAESYSSPAFFTDPKITSSSVFRLSTESPFFGHYKRLDDYVYLMVYHPSTLTSWFAEFLDEVKKFPAHCRISDETGAFVAGSSVTDRKPIIKTQLGNYFDGWTTELYIDDSAFEIAADRQAAIYTWTGVLMIVMVLASGTVVARAIGRQMKLNRLKNDFIATVTHELKTPLASTRVLVDTLLEGNINDSHQATEYLQLIDKENVRLSRMIDNFLTFSRMERNKQVFDRQPADPAEIARKAADALHTKFHNGHCVLNMALADKLPLIPADKDAIVTVLVNLLDNAYKYSYDNKQIGLRVYQQDNSVCFEVKDNGIGMTRRAIKKIFNRFYQVDSSLARRAEGAGLGLSIVKYIVDAHHGRIDVQSKPGHGTTFTVLLPK